MVQGLDLLMESQNTCWSESLQSCFQSFHFIEEKSEVQGGVSLGVECESLDSDHQCLLSHGVVKVGGTEEKRAGILERPLVWESGNFCSSTISVIKHLHEFRKSISLLSASVSFF